MKKLTQSEFCCKVSSINENVLVIGEYLGADKRILVRCLVDNHEWSPYAGELTRQEFRGCPKCAHKLSKSNAIKTLDSSLLISRNIQILGQYTGSSKKITVRCLIDGHEWSPTYENLMNGSGCPACFERRRRTQHEQFITDLRKISPDIHVVSKYSTMRKHIEVKCLVSDCGHEWSPTPHSLLKGLGCPRCAIIGRRKPHDNFVKELHKLNPYVDILGEYLGNKYEIGVRCKICNHTWSPRAGSLLGGGCPICNSGGYNTQKPATLYVYNFSGCYGFGISNNFYERNKNHTKTFNDIGINFNLVRTYDGSGRDILELETVLKRSLPIYNTGVDGFKTEAVEEHDGILLFRLIEDFQKQRDVV
jgi:hypothetical protein